MFKIERLSGIEILDSRGRPTVKARCRLASGDEGVASVPSGASTGTAEALELRDGDPKRYRGLGCKRAVANVNDVLNRALQGRAFPNQSLLDEELLRLDGTPNKARLGANALLAVSMAFARACAQQQKTPLYRHFQSTAAGTLPRPTINLFSGGKHAGAQAPLQDILVVPIAAKSMDEALAQTFAVYQAAADLIAKKYGMRLLRADEGGLAPPFAHPEAMLQDAMTAISAAGLNPGREIALAVDVAATHFYEAGVYQLGKSALTSEQMIAQLRRWTEQYPIVSIEDGLSEEDWSHWPQLLAAVGKHSLVLGDDFLCTNPARIKRAIREHAANALLLKVNQIGTLSEAWQACQLARSAGWHVTVSARSGETEDDWLADLAVGWSGDHIKIGSITQSERLSKYNRLLEIEAETGWPMKESPYTQIRGCASL